MSKIVKKYYLNHKWITRCLFLGPTSRRGSRPFLSPEVSQDMGDGNGSSGRGRSTGTSRRDSLSPDSATDECEFDLNLFFFFYGIISSYTLEAVGSTFGTEPLDLDQFSINYDACSFLGHWIDCHFPKFKRLKTLGSSKEMGFLNPNYPFFGESRGAV